MGPHTFLMHVSSIHSARPDEAPAVTAEELAGVTRRLGRVWLEGTNAMAANELIDKEISQLLLTSRARLQAEVVVSDANR